MCAHRQARKCVLQVWWSFLFFDLASLSTNFDCLLKALFKTFMRLRAVHQDQSGSPALLSVESRSRFTEGQDFKISLAPLHVASSCSVSTNVRLDLSDWDLSQDNDSDVQSYLPYRPCLSAVPDALDRLHMSSSKRLRVAKSDWTYTSPGQVYQRNKQVFLDLWLLHLSRLPMSHFKMGQGSIHIWERIVSGTLNSLQLSSDLVNPALLRNDTWGRNVLICPVTICPLKLIPLISSTYSRGVLVSLKNKHLI